MADCTLLYALLEYFTHKAIKFVEYTAGAVIYTMMKTLTNKITNPSSTKNLTKLDVDI